MDRKTFGNIEELYGCGYWNVCSEHSCPCGPSARVTRGYDGRTYNAMRVSFEKEKQEQNRLYNSYEFEECDY